jgi:hypothetical protein
LGGTGGFLGLGNFRFFFVAIVSFHVRGGTLHFA